MTRQHNVVSVIPIISLQLWLYNESIAKPPTQCKSMRKNVINAVAQGTNGQLDTGMQRPSMHLNYQSSGLQSLNRLVTISSVGLLW